jgi:branched-chain amino acid aminotransferase
VTITWVNGRILDSAGSTVPAADRGFLLGDGLFETMRGRAQAVFRLDAHLERLEHGAERLGIPVPDGVRSAIAAVMDVGLAGHPERAELAESALRLTLSRGPGGEGLEPPAAVEPTLVISLRPLPAFPAKWYRSGISLRLSSYRLSARSATAGIKAIGYLPNILALREARAAGADDALVLDERERLAEASASNLFWVDSGGGLCTPSAACGILPGITRSAVLELARSWGVSATEGEWGLEALVESREAFTTSSLRGIVPITILNGEPVGGGRMGELTRRVIAGYQELFLRETEAPGP